MEYAILTNKSIPIYSIICNALKEGNEGKNIADILNNPCNTLSLQISKSLINVAATRIFSNPYQSILELPVNSIDSYAELQGRPSIGKFGLGFYSILYWVVNNKATLQITSRVPEYEWSGTINNLTDGPHFTLSMVPTPQRRRGTTMRLQGVDYNTLTKFKEELQKLIYIKSAKIFINNVQINPRSTSNDIINIKIRLTEKYIEVEDFAGGITLPVLFNSLLIPTISTKSVSRSLQYDVNDTDTIDNNNIYISDKPSFTIMVGNVEVKRVRSEGPNVSVILSLPLETRLPTSRDDVILDDNIKPYVLKALDKLLDVSLQGRDVRPLQHALKAYISESSTQYNRRLFSEYLQRIDEKVRKDNYIVVLSKYFNLFTTLAVNAGVIFIRSLSYNPLELDNFLETRYGNLMRSDIYYGKNILLLPHVYVEDAEAEVTSGGSTRTLFLSQQLLNMDPNWKTNIPTSITDDILIPLDFIKTLNNNKELRKLDKLPGSTKIKTLLKSLLLKLSALDVYYSFNNTKHIRGKHVSYHSSMNIWNLFILDYYTFYGMERINEFSDFILLWFKTIPSLVPTNIAYGQDMVQFGTGLRRGDNINVIPPIESRLQSFNDISIQYIDKWKPYINSGELRNKVFSYQVQFSKFMVEVANKETPSYFSSILFPSPLYFVNYDNILNNINLILTLSSNFYDFIVISSILTYAHIDANEIFIRDSYKILREEYIPQDLENVVRDIIIEKDVNPMSLNNINDRLTRHQEILKEITEGYNYKLQIEKLSTSPIQTNLQNIISKIFKVPPTPNESFIDFIKDANNYSLDRKLQLIEVTVNENTTKSPLEASLIELVQNSVDAINNTPSSNRKINIFTSRDPSSPILNVVVEDDVGIPDSAMLSLSVPFVSSKSGTTSVGQIGTGFFNVYRDSKYVTIDTYRDGNRTSIIDVPVRDGFDRVVDINKNIFREKSKEKNGTRIILSISYKTERDRNIDEGHVYYICKNIINKTIQPPSVYINNQQITSDYIPIVAYNSLDFLGKKGDEQSYVLTRGIPYSDFVSFALSDAFGVHPAFRNQNVYEVLRDNIFINMKQNFTPASNRTSINISSEYVSDIQKSIRNGIYLSILWKILESLIKNPNYFIPNYTSNFGRQTGFVIMSNFSKIVNISTFMVNYKPEDYINGKWKEYKSIAHGINTIIASKNRKNREDTIAKLKKDYHPLQYSIIRRWIANKTDLDEKDAPPPIPLTLLPTTTTQPRKEGEIEQTPLPPTSKLVIDNINILQKFFTSFVQAFWTLASNIIKSPVYNKRGIPVVNIGPDVASRGAYYSSKLHVISINSSKLDHLVKIVTDLYLSKDENAFKDNWLKYRNNDRFKEYFGYVFPSSTIVHELEHARRQSEHSSTSHSEIIDESIGGKNPISFDDSANKVYDIILRNNFVSQVYKYLKS
ncbi:Histidine kinase-like ATPase [Orpheovirus IHUMI-LCC2]|uniref:Histidine kinase-like ATPase n=1 Tax=Orpheovirus IHUMI-LCC2 TaxID=2023057 RepID=A0A2I2L6D8_9VIRU|nr:Histidine kinase-like ATPase [Orpheovirus IHUMI-LCC2]SNW63103.1 Histidine kinase-like ATPase [Orpheovirus IHUMI-LCC2]